MKKVILFCSAILLFCVMLSSCTRGRQFKLQGTISGFTGSSLTLTYYDADSGDLKFVIPVKDGKFEFKTDKLKNPYVAVLSGVTFSRTIAIAPGYDLTITADVKSNRISFDGQGSSSNKLYTAIDTINIAAFFDKPLSKEEFADSLEHAKIAANAPMSILLQKNADKNDKYYMFFAGVTSYDISFKRFGLAMEHFDRDAASFSVPEVDSLIKVNFDSLVVHNITDQEYLVSPQYRKIMGKDFHYLSYKVKADHQKNQSAKLNESDYLEEINKIYTGRVKEFVTAAFNKVKPLSTLSP